MSQPMGHEDAAVAGGERVALPPLEIVVVIEPLVHLLAHVELHDPAKACVDGLGKVRLARGEEVEVHLQSLELGAECVVGLRVEIVREEQVARVVLGDARLLFRRHQWRDHVAHPRVGSLPVDPSLGLPQDGHVIVVAVLLHLRDALSGAAEDDGDLGLLQDRNQARCRRRWATADAELSGGLALVEAGLQAVDAHALGTDIVVGGLRAVDEGQRDLVHVEAAIRHVEPVGVIISKP
mmetsp:Transcript_28027/g.82379  ORF Transcript_28027/g.82379 Transcript_28027/m.82379 type:complete len:237 (-) Transcript_28027:107-817(-)